MSSFPGFSLSGSPDLGLSRFPFFLCGCQLAPQSAVRPACCPPWWAALRALLPDARNPSRFVTSSSSEALSLASEAFRFGFPAAHPTWHLLVYQRPALMTPLLRGLPEALLLGFIRTLPPQALSPRCMYTFFCYLCTICLLQMEVSALYGKLPKFCWVNECHPHSPGPLDAEPWWWVSDSSSPWSSVYWELRKSRAQHLALWTSPSRSHTSHPWGLGAAFPVSRLCPL